MTTFDKEQLVKAMAAIHVAGSRLASREAERVGDRLTPRARMGDRVRTAAIRRRTLAASGSRPRS